MDWKDIRALLSILSSSLDSLVKNVSKDDFKYLSQDKVLDLVKQKRFYPYEHMSDFGKFKEQMSSKEESCSSLTGRKITKKEYDHVVNVSNKFKIKTMKYYHELHLKYDVL